MESKILIGDIIKSTQGRDAGNLYVVKEVLNDNYVLLVDGKAKTINKPKKKKNKHITSLNMNSSVLKEKFISQKLVQDAEIRKALRNYMESL